MGDQAKCLICSNPVAIVDVAEGGQLPLNRVLCPRCGPYRIGFGEIRAYHNGGMGNSDTQRALISGWVRENQDVELSDELIESLKNLTEISPRKKAIKLLTNLAKENSAVGHTWFFEDEIESARFFAFAWAKDNREFRYLLENYLDKHFGWVEINENDGWSITPKGWEFLESPDQSPSVQGFIAMSFAEELDHIGRSIERAIQAAGYEALIMKRHEHVNRIDEEILAQIRKSRFVVADLTTQNQGAYLEAGFALGLEKQVVWTCTEKEKNEIHFDTRQFNTIFWEDEKLAEFEKALSNRIERIFGEGPEKL